MTGGSARAFWIVGPGRGRVIEEALPSPGEGEVLVEAIASGVSRGTETLVFTGRVPPSQYRAMRAPFQGGDFPALVKYGYASVGRVVATGGANGDHLLGRVVFCLHPHQDRYVIPVEAVIPVPDRVPAARAVLAANMETAVNALWDAGPRIGDRIAVIGAGVVGCLVAALAARLPGAVVELVDIDPAKAAVVGALGVPFRLPDEAGGERDLVIHASGSPTGLADALRLAGFEATVIEMSWFADQNVALPLGEAFHSRRLTIRSSQVGAVSPARRARRGHRDRLALALGLLADPIFDCLIDSEGRLEDLPQTMTEIADGRRSALCHRVTYEG